MWSGSDGSAEYWPAIGHFLIGCGCSKAGKARGVIKKLHHLGILTHAIFFSNQRFELIFSMLFQH
jgi:hypothetical protein